MLALSLRMRADIERQLIVSYICLFHVFAFKVLEQEPQSALPVFLFGFLVLFGVREFAVFVPLGVQKSLERLVDKTFDLSGWEV